MGERKVEEVIVGGREVRVVHAFDFKATRFFWSDLVKLISFASFREGGHRSPEEVTVDGFWALETHRDACDCRAALQLPLLSHALRSFALPRRFLLSLL